MMKWKHKFSVVIINHTASSNILSVFRRFRFRFSELSNYDLPVVD